METKFTLYDTLFDVNYQDIMFHYNLIFFKY